MLIGKKLGEVLTIFDLKLKMSNSKILISFFFNSQKGLKQKELNGVWLKQEPYIIIKKIDSCLKKYFNP